MFQKINLSLDFKDLEMIQNSLANEISCLNNQVFISEDDKEVINEHKQLLKTINNSLNKLKEGN